MRSPLLLTLLIASNLVAPAFGQSAADRAQAWEDNAREIPCQRYALFTDLPEDEARIIADNMDLLHKTSSDFFKDFDGRVPSGDQVCVFGNQEDYMAWLKDRVDADGTGSAGMFVQRGEDRALVAWKGDMPLTKLLGTLRHEGFHHVASELFPGIPVWANEGMAGLFERSVPVSNGLALGNVRSQDVARLRQAVKRDALMRLNAFFRVDPKRWSNKVRKGDASVNYLQAWAVCQFLLYGEEGKYKQGFLIFLGNMNDGMGWKTAFQEAYGVKNYALIEKRFLVFVDSIKPSDLELVVPRMILMGEGMKSLIDNGEQVPSAGACAGRLRADGFETKLPKQYGGGTFSTQIDSPFLLPKETGGELRFADDKGKPLQGACRRPSIIARNLAPRELLLRWTDKDTWEIYVDN
jgi:hypothetical protein